MMADRDHLCVGLYKYDIYVVRYKILFVVLEINLSVNATINVQSYQRELHHRVHTC